jgi:hypothetical protein
LAAITPSAMRAFNVVASALDQVSLIADSPKLVSTKIFRPVF